MPWLQARFLYLFFLILNKNKYCVRVDLLFYAHEYEPRFPLLVFIPIRPVTFLSTISSLLNNGRHSSLPSLFILPSSSHIIKHLPSILSYPFAFPLSSGQHTITQDKAFSRLWMNASSSFSPPLEDGMRTSKRWKIKMRRKKEMTAKKASFGYTASKCGDILNKAIIWNS